MAFRLSGFPLSADGKRKAKAISNYFKNKKIVAIYSSPILRTKQTAEIIASELNLKVSIAPLLIETKTPFQGMSFKKFFKRRKDIYFDEEHIKGGGESIEEINARMSTFIKRILEKHPNSEVIAVSHGDPIMIYTATLIEGEEGIKGMLHRKDYIPTGGILELVFDKDKKLESYAKINY